MRPERTEAFRRAHQRDALSAAWGFRVVWHEQRHAIAALDGETVAGLLDLRIAASLAHVDALIVAPERRRNGLGRALLERAEVLANYYNCHKVVVEALAGGEAQAFFEACGYRVEAVLPQHTWKRDVAVMRKFVQ